MKEAPDLTETVWELDRPPYGTYDKIALHQLKRTELTKSEAVIVYFPPSATNAALYTEDIANAEKYDFRIYLAEKNYEIYSVDYRTAFVTGEEEGTDYSFMGDWTTEVFISDLREAGKQVKKISGKKFFVAGHSTGGRYVYHFTAKNKSSVKGIISLDGGPWESDGSPSTLYVGNWRGKMPDERLNYFKNLKKIEIPLIVFSSEKWTTALGMQHWYKELGTVLIGGTDTKYVLLEGFGHLDVLMGTYAEKKVFEPLHQWLEKRKK